jgi:hypothetical protein
MVDIAATDWTGGLGRINKDVIMKGLPRPSHDTLILVGKLTVTPTISFFFHTTAGCSEIFSELHQRMRIIHIRHVWLFHITVITGNGLYLCRYLDHLD